MPFLASAHQNIQLRVNDLMRGDTKLGQVAVVVGQGYTQPRKTGIMSVYIQLEIVLYALAGPDLASPLDEDPRFVTLEKTLDGKNDTLVDATTGEILGMYRQYNDVADWGTFCRSFGSRNVMLQGDYYERKRGEQVVTADEITLHLQAAMSLGLFL